MKHTLSLVALLLTLILNTQGQDKDGWISLFDGKSFDGWKISEHPESFTIKDGIIQVFGSRAHLFYDGKVGNHNFKNFEFKVTVMTTPGSNSGLFVHTAFQDTGWPSKGYEIQVNQTHTDWIKTGSIYGIKNVKETFVKDDEWYTEHIIVQGKRIIVKVNDKVINDFTETDQGQLSSGTIALQAHDPKSKIFYKNIMVRILPD